MLEREKKIIIHIYVFIYTESYKYMSVRERERESVCVFFFPFSFDKGIFCEIQIGIWFRQRMTISHKNHAFRCQNFSGEHL